MVPLVTTTYRVPDCVVIPGERIERSQLLPPLAELGVGLQEKAADIRSDLVEREILGEGIRSQTTRTHYNCHLYIIRHTHVTAIFVAVLGPS